MGIRLYWVVGVFNQFLQIDVTDDVKLATTESEFFRVQQDPHLIVRENSL